MKQLEALSIVTPGFFGLNTQESGVTLSPNFAQVADNVIIDKYGRLGARKGWTMQTTTGSNELGGESIKFMLEHVNADDSLDFLSAGNNKVFTGGVGAVLTDVTPAAYTITSNDWSGATLNDTSILVQEDQEPLIYSSVASPVVQTITTYTGVTQNFNTAYPTGVIAAWGRYWSFTKNSIYWSTDIVDTAFPAFNAGSSGSLNIASVLPDNTDDIVAIAAHNNFLIIFCRHHIVIYSGADNPISATFGLQDIIVGVGCVAHKSVQNTGSDLVFLSDTGIRSLGRLLQEKSLPMRDLTINVRDDLLDDLNTEASLAGNLDNISSVYSEINAFYLISFPALNTVYCLDMRSALENGAARVTIWNQYEAASFLRLRNRDVLIGKVNGIGKYIGYTDNTASYRVRYYSHYFDFGSPTTTKIIKKISATILGGANQQFTIKVATNYSGSYRSYPFVLQAGEIFEYNVAKYPTYSEFKGVVANYAALPGGPNTGDAYMTIDNNNVYQWSGSEWTDVTSTWKTSFTVTDYSEFSKGIVLEKIRSSVGGYGSTIQIGFESDVYNAELSVQKIDVFIKVGRTE
jgi:hypothetical protein